MKKYFKRVVALSMVCAMCLTAVGCKSKPADDESYLSYYYEEVEVTKDNTDSDTASTTSKNGNNNTKKNSSNVGKNSSSTNEITGEDVDLKGYKFTIYSVWMAKSEKDAVMSQENTLYKVAKQIEDKYGCEITVTGTQDLTTDTMRTLIMSGSKVADAVEILAEKMLPYAAAGYIAPWDSMDGIDPTDKKFVQGYTNMGAIEGKHYGISFLRPPEARMCVIFNKGILNSSIGAGTSDKLYDLVKSKKWTWSKMEEYAKEVVAKNTVNNQTNIWGVGGWYDKLLRGIYVSNGATLATVKNGKGVTTFNSQNMIEAMNFVDKLINTDKVYDAEKYRNPSTFDTRDNQQYCDAFANGKLAFLFEETFWVDQYFNQSFDYGIVPVPMGPKAKDYMTESGKAKIMALTSTNAKSKDAKKSVAILNMLADGCAAGGNLNGKYDGEDWWEYDLKQDYFRNDRDKNLEMYNILLDTAVVDWGAGVEDLRSTFLKKVGVEAIFGKKGTVTSAIQGIGSSYDKAVSSAFTFK